MLDAFHRRQSPESIYFRYFQYRPELSDAELEFFTKVDYAGRMAFVALLGGAIVAVARYETPSTGGTPEVAFFVDDGHHGRGLATLMLEYLAAAAREQDITAMTATVLPENHAMLGVFRKAGFGVKTWFDDGVIGVDIDLTLTSETADAIAMRHSRARSRSVARLLEPDSVAVVGAGRRPGSVGHELLRQLLGGGFAGDLHAINPAAEEEVLGVRCLPSLAAIGGPVDLVIVAVPAVAVEQVVADAAEIGAEGLLIISSGFSEAGPEGEERERRLVAMARGNGMRLVGPNSFGLVNTAPEVQLRALFLPVGPPAGAVAMISQSGPLGGAVLEHMRAAGVGMSSFVAAGNRADVSVNDVLDYWLVDEATRVVLLHVENYGNLRNFAGTVRALSMAKPVVTVRPAEENLVELLAQAGVVLVDGIAEMADVARVAAEQPTIAGSRVVVVSNAASVARLAVSACRRFGLDVVGGVGPAATAPSTLSPSASRSPAGSTEVDAIVVADVDSATAGPEAGSVEDGGEAATEPDYERVLVEAAVRADVDAVLVALVPNLHLAIDDLATVLGTVNRSIDKPIVAAGLVGEDLLAVPGVPVFEFPDEAARTLAHLAAHTRWRRSVPSQLPAVDDDAAAELDAEVRPVVAALLDAADADRVGESGAAEPDGIEIDLLSEDARSMVAALDLPVPPWRVVEAPGDLAPAASEIGYPVVLKAGGIGTRTVGEAGGAAIDLQDAAQLDGAFTRMVAAQGGAGAAVLPGLVQAMVPSTGNAKIELVQDPDLGAFVRIGLGGAVGATLPPVDRRFLPLLDGEALEMADRLASSMPLDSAARAVVVRILERLAALGAVIGELALVELDPVLIAASDTAIGDLRIRAHRWTRDPFATVRRL